jgi:hypothetical protein
VNLRLPNGRPTLNAKQLGRTWTSLAAPVAALLAPLGYDVTRADLSGVDFTHATGTCCTMPVPVVAALAQGLKSSLKAQRAEVRSKVEAKLKEMRSKGGRTTAARMTPEERRTKMQAMSQARWEKVWTARADGKT